MTFESARNRVLQWATFARTWWIYDAQHQCPLDSGQMLTKYLQGKHKPIYHPLSDAGDHVVVINTRHVAMEGDLWRTWKYFHHTRYPGGFSTTSAWRLHEIDPTKVIYKAVYHSLPGNLLRKTMMRRLHLYPDDEVPDEILKNVSDQICQLKIIPKRLDQYLREEIETFPKLFDWIFKHQQTLTNLQEYHSLSYAFPQLLASQLATLKLIKRKYSRDGDEYYSLFVENEKGLESTRLTLAKARKRTKFEVKDSLYQRRPVKPND